ncbi:MAG: hypothetical protein KGH65_03935 [Candidatus Micrarchaeota archaeon]|nr:hypothetical protein [Candidatus Micrarchaeota archaeon]
MEERWRVRSEREHTSDLLRDTPGFEFREFEHRGRVWTIESHIFGMGYDGLEERSNQKGAIHLVKANCSGEAAYAVLRIFYPEQNRPRVYALALEKMLSDAHLRYLTKASEIIDRMDMTAEGKEILKRQVRGY